EVGAFWIGSILCASDACARLRDTAPFRAAQPVVGFPLNSAGRKESASGIVPARAPLGVGKPHARKGRARKKPQLVRRLVLFQLAWSGLLLTFWLGLCLAWAL